jgi:hypothetical protein
VFNGTGLIVTLAAIFVRKDSSYTRLISDLHYSHIGDSMSIEAMDLDDDFLPMPGSFPRYVIQQPHDAPIRRLPFEILGNIFVNCLEGTFILPHINDAPLLLGRVCRAWRLVTISTPLLWTSVLVQLPPKTTSASLQLGLHCWLLRSGALPLTIRIDSHPVYGLPSDFFDIFSLSFTRWHNLKLHIPSEYLPHLLQHSESWGSRLTRLTLSSDTSINDYLDILSRCPRLQDIFFPRLRGYVSSSDRSPIILPELHTMKLFTGKDTDVFPSFHFLQLPLLRNLDMIIYFPQQWDKQWLLSLLARSNCALVRLHIGSLGIPPEDLTDYVLRIPSLLEVSHGDLLPKDVRDILAHRRLQEQDRRENIGQ